MPFILLVVISCGMRNFCPPGVNTSTRGSTICPPACRDVSYCPRTRGRGSQGISCPPSSGGRAVATTFAVESRSGIRPCRPGARFQVATACAFQRTRCDCGFHQTKPGPHFKFASRLGGCPSHTHTQCRAGRGQRRRRPDPVSLNCLECASSTQRPRLCPCFKPIVECVSEGGWCLCARGYTARTCFIWCHVYGVRWRLQVDWTLPSLLPYLSLPLQWLTM